MDLSPVGLAKHCCCHALLPLLCLLGAASLASADAPVNRLRSGTESHSQPRNAPREEPPREGNLDKPVQQQASSDLELYRVQFGPGQSVRKARYAQQTLPEPERTYPPVAQSDLDNSTQTFESPVRQTSLQYAVPAEQTQQTAISRTGYVHCAAPYDGCDAMPCFGGCEPGCGCEPACGCKPGYGCDSCGGGYGPTCGIEPSCGLETYTWGRASGWGKRWECGWGNFLRGMPGYRPNGPRRLSLRGEYLLWWVDGFHIPPMLTTSTAGTDIADAGVLGLSSTRIVYGNQTVLDGARNGGRVTLNYWLDACQSYGIQASYFGLERKSSTFATDSSQFPILARPFFNSEPGVGQQDAELIAFPGVLAGGALVETESRLQGAEVLYRHAALTNCNFRLDFLVGYRNYELDESLHFSDFKEVLSTDLGLPVGTTLTEGDWFDTSNSFNGVSLGILTEHRNCNWSWECMVKLALGNNRSKVAIDGHAQFIEPGNPPTVTNTPAGLLAQQTNIGVQQRDDFTVVPELGITLGYDLNCYWRATMGYTCMYWSRVARPGDQVDTNLNLTQLEPTGLVGEPRPIPTGRMTDLWAQGLGFGLQAQF